MKIIFAILFIASYLQSQQLSLSKNPLPVKNGSDYVKQILPLNRSDREDSIYAFVVDGYIPNFLRTLIPIITTAVINNREYTLEYFVTPDYLSIGNDNNYFLCPMTPLLAQKIANSLDCILPTKKMVDQIYTAAFVKLPPQPIPPDSLMTMMPRFIEHNDSVQMLRKSLINQFPLGSLVAGTKKDIIIHQKNYSELKNTTFNFRKQ